MLFNKDKNGTAELRALTGNYYKSNDFAKVEVFIERATEELQDIVGNALISKVDKLYNSTEEITDNDKTLIKKLQRPIAIKATLLLYQRNDISHEDSGRKIKLDNDNEKLPWEWQLERDDRIHLEDYYQGVDSLIKYLDDNKTEEWMLTKKRLGIHGLLIRSGKDFDDFFPLNSERVYIMLLSFLKEAQRKYIKPVFGDDKFDELLNTISKADRNTILPDEYEYAGAPLALMTISTALTRMPISIMPEGLVRQAIKTGGTDTGMPSLKDIKEVAKWLQEEAKVLIDDLKLFLRDNKTKNYKLLPDNDKKNKYMRV
ncbi:MAG: hypothetical protein H6Q12_24 [Bacteroidetes bacterium]|nr:hypothetical protein [Bacteroidota bacterium]